MDGKKVINKKTKLLDSNKAITFVGAFFVPFLSQVPITSFTSYGQIYRMLGIILIFILCLLNKKNIVKNITIHEIQLFYYLICIECIGAIIGLYYYIDPDIFMVCRFLFLNVFIYLLGRSYTSAANIERGLNIFYKISVVAALTGIAALTAEYYDIRRLYAFILETNADAPYCLTWYGLLGGDVGDDGNGRSNFFFSEATHFAHYLFPGIAYALSTKRYFGLVILLVGFITTFSALGSLALAGMIFLILLKSKEKTVYLITLMLSLLVIVPLLDKYINKSNDLRGSLFSRSGSFEDKLNSAKQALKILHEKPLGIGIVQSDKLFQSSVNTAPGFFNWILWFGWLGIIFVVFIISLLVIKMTQCRTNIILFSLTACIFFLFIGTLSHGPSPKYYLSLLFGMMIRLQQLKRQQDLNTEKTSNQTFKLVPKQAT